MSHVRNIKEMLSVSTGNRNAATSGYSSMTDSQLFFGSQFWPENSQSTSQDMSLSSRTSQQSSQEGSDPKFSNCYHTKPLLFGELKDKVRGFAIVDNFEEDRKRAKENNDSELLAKECQHIRETFNNIQQLVSGMERNMTEYQTVFEKFENFASTLQNNLNHLQSDISKQFQTFGNELNSHKYVMTKLEEKVKKSGDTIAELGSNLQTLKSSLESLRVEQQREQNTLEEALRLLTRLVSEHSADHRPTDGVIHRSPGPEESLSNILQGNKLENTQLQSTSYNIEDKQVELPPKNPRYSTGKRKLTLVGHRRQKKRPLVLPQRSKGVIQDENSQPPTNGNKQQNVSAPLRERRDLNTLSSRDNANPECLTTLNREKRSSKASGYNIIPLSCWSQDSTSSSCITGIESILDKMVADSKMRPDGFRQLFDIDCDSDSDL